MAGTKALGRDRHLDGLRGVAALAVVVEHFSALLPISRLGPAGSIAAEFRASLIHFPFEAGTFAVYIFFAISGVVVANAASGKPWPGSLVRRYARLTAPMLVAGIMAWAVLAAYPSGLPVVANFLPNHWTTTIYQEGPPSLPAALIESIYGAYLSGNPKINPVLWSMQIELWGSFGIFTSYRFIAPRWRIRLALGIALMLTVLGLWQYLPFPLGALLFELNARGYFRWKRRIGLAVAIAGILLGVVATLSALRYYSAILSSHVGEDPRLKVLFSSAGGLMVVIGVLASETGKTLLTTTAPLFLGRVSYGLYLVHMPILYGPFVAAYLALGRPPGWGLLTVWGIAFFATAFAAAWAVTVAVDEPVTRLLKVKRPAVGKHQASAG